MNGVSEYQAYAQNLQNLLIQKQTLQIQLEELKQTLEELKNYDKEKVYKSVGPVLIEDKKINVVKELEEQKEEIEIKLKSFESKEKLLKNKLEDIRLKLTSNPQN